MTSFSVITPATVPNYAITGSEVFANGLFWTSKRGWKDGGGRGQSWRTPLGWLDCGWIACRST